MIRLFRSYVNFHIDCKIIELILEKRSQTAETGGKTVDILEGLDECHRLIRMDFALAHGFEGFEYPKWCSEFLGTNRHLGSSLFAHSIDAGLQQDEDDDEG
jgi:hypothetical protein